MKGDSDDGIGVLINGGFIYTNTSADAGKGIKTDTDVTVNGGTLQLNTSGNAVYDADELDTSSSACIKTDGSININGGSLTLKSTGTGGKGLNADGDIAVSGGSTVITTSGGKFTYTEELTSSPKGAKADGNVTITGGTLAISVTGISDGSEGLESKAIMTISGGEVYVRAYDDAINAADAINISGGKIYAYAENNDGIDSNGTLNISGGLVIASGTMAPESGIDVDNSNYFTITGGTILACGGSLQSNPSTSSSTQNSLIYNGISITEGDMTSILNSESEPILTWSLPRTLSGATLFLSSHEIVTGSSYTVVTGGEISGYSDSWNGWYDGGLWTGGTELQTFSPTGVNTTIGSSMGGPGGNNPVGPGNPGGGPGGFGW